MQKYPDSDAAVQIAEEAFRAGYEAALWDVVAEEGGAYPEHLHYWQAWCAFEPSEACKDLVG